MSTGGPNTNTGNNPMDIRDDGDVQSGRAQAVRTQWYAMLHALGLPNYHLDQPDSQRDAITSIAEQVRDRFGIVLNAQGMIQEAQKILTTESRFRQEGDARAIQVAERILERLYRRMSDAQMNDLIANESDASTPEGRYRQGILNWLRASDVESKNILMVMGLLRQNPHLGTAEEGDPDFENDDDAEAFCDGVMKRYLRSQGLRPRQVENAFAHINAYLNISPETAKSVANSAEREFPNAAGTEADILKNWSKEDARKGLNKLFWQPYRKQLFQRGPAGVGMTLDDSPELLPFETVERAYFMTRHLYKLPESDPRRLPPLPEVLEFLRRCHRVLLNKAQHDLEVKHEFEGDTEARINAAKQRYFEDRDRSDQYAAQANRITQSVMEKKKELDDQKKKIEEAPSAARRFFIKETKERAVDMTKWGAGGAAAGFIVTAAGGPVMWAVGPLAGAAIGALYGRFKDKGGDKK